MVLSQNDSLPALRFNGVSKRFGRTAVLCDLQATVTTGSSVGLVGVNGAGKTTLLKCLLDFCHLDGGSIQIFGVSHRYPLARRRMTFLPERFVPPYYLSGREFLHVMRSMSGLAYAEEEALALLQALDLPADALKKPSRALSKGMTQKLGLAGCLLSGRDLYILDEPMSGLDPLARAQVKALFSDLRKQGKTMLFTSHSLADIGEICDHMIVLHQGSIAFSGTPEDFRARHGESRMEQAFLRCIGLDG